MQNAGKHSKNITIQGLRGASCIIVYITDTSEKTFLPEKAHKF